MLLDFFLAPLVYAALAAFVAFFVSPVQYVKVVRQDTARSYSSIFRETWYRDDCLRIFFGGAAPYVVMNFLSNLSFGLSDMVSERVLPLGYGILTGIFFRALLGGAIETLMTVYPEVREIVRNKRELASGDGKVSSVLFPSFLRNSVAWLGSTSAYEISTRFHLESGVSILLSVCMGLIFAIVSIPFDVLVTQSCAAREELTLLNRVLRIMRDSKNKFLLGSVIRVLQIVIFTAVTVSTMFFIRYLGI
ncbi:hypothetical protein NHE_0886 [Neorickettsia helminthoeca str. Oregon]|uniref:Uncharacterized protein n=1 Tax=Neorickettsia helminthoeca str. Oregon TaxID=1286528 RepID=X5HMT4_9RICK|nr:hypothetical protein [Neorickettsia helminthoeca]AHX11805.1 hypothetical protein NHE_0886 [Neorickettsia helminthoeca str. Oregon]